jgi:hypothetical protein
MNSTLKSQFEYYLVHQDEFVKKYNGRVIVIKDEQVLGDYEDELTAVNETKKQHAVGTFLVQRVSPGEAAYVQTFHSRVAFS